MTPDDGVDLHLHTTVHDGRWTPAGLVQHAARHGITCLAVADHDMTAGIAPARAAAAPLGVIVLPAVEVTSLWRGREYHVLVYGEGIDPPSAALRALLGGIHARQLARAAAWVDALAGRGMLLPSLDAVRRGRALMPIYVMGALIRDGHVPDYPSCVRLVRTLPPAEEPAAPLEEVAAAAHAGGGVALVAHPGRNENGFAALGVEDLAAMIAAGPLDGLEVYHPNHGDALRRMYLEFAQARGLLVSAGSDSHGPAHSRLPAPHPARLCWPLLERCLSPSAWRAATHDATHDATHRAAALRSAGPTTSSTPARPAGEAPAISPEEPPDGIEPPAPPAAATTTVSPAPAVSAAPASPASALSAAPASPAPALSPAPASPARLAPPAGSTARRQSRDG